MLSIVNPGDQSEFPVACLLISGVWQVAVVIRELFARSNEIRKSKLRCHAIYDRRGSDGSLWCVYLLFIQNRNPSGLGTRVLE